MNTIRENIVLYNDGLMLQSDYDRLIESKCEAHVQTRYWHFENIRQSEIAERIRLKKIQRDKDNEESFALFY